jgi:FtsP/CotA-like multicopper oxidase with cupredoxin domain
MKMNAKIATTLLAPLVLALAAQAGASVPGSTGTGGAGCAGASVCFNLTARKGQITLGDGNTLLAWGFGAGAMMQYPGTTLIVSEGDTVRVTLSNTLPVKTSIVFPGQTGVVATGGTTGLLTNEAGANGSGGTVSYTFTAGHAGTYLYQSGTEPEVQIEMGLVGALIVRPAGFAEGTDDAHPQRRAYADASSAYDREYLFFLTDIDRSAHEAVQQGAPIDPANFKATLWFINGRNGPDTMLKGNVGWLPSQPYNALARMHPGDRVLMRIVGAGRDLHPFHHHGNNAWLIARDGRVLQSAPGASAIYPDFAGLAELASRNATLPDQSISNFTIQIVPGGTYDAIFTWTGQGLNWDFYGHTGAECANPASIAASRVLYEDPASHCKAVPVKLPEQQSLTFGGLWSGSPFLEKLAALPPLQGGLNPGGGYSFMWHSHTERELTNDDIFPGGMMTMMIIEGPGVPLNADGEIVAE